MATSNGGRSAISAPSRSKAFRLASYYRETDPRDACTGVDDTIRDLSPQECTYNEDMAEAMDQSADRMSKIVKKSGKFRDVWKECKAERMERAEDAETGSVVIYHKKRRSYIPGLERGTVWE
ncbi:hypothetical protein HBI25_170740 [Parastagonospora nodorum]|nr:hypothetical protein HBH50_090000 [Parastagonospora nodorum]KAH4092872.1 hypothetical protein HBH48_073400 [Parastagonospora nodorum]KAH4206792.1 hypothetical protein HBI95_120580 [Parastagonospora nodorum]KAH4287376.1 hypothetical protein HBI02_216230 [Parastagonospora nodorum]KAH4292207.1 hypothetical protein HBI01_184230 [Parastagonospora nodorum]